ncbi:transmembrane inner ear expressed protein [Plakobranchus ocellatus]|uniref:Transmembrane inner ear expressed protein n=1 Tax=Plakobranchus ocellatus TaxID=259542 RepID=A0AAV3YWU0_9GAST|nr:transmembrane inner ear expressed protein [Plakobranchus ocellatus]
MRNRIISAACTAGESERCVDFRKQKCSHWLEGPASCSVSSVFQACELEEPTDEQQETVTHGDTSTDQHIEDRGIEEEILGPFRTWHIIFTSMFIVITIIVVICCCHSFRIPRTRQEIEDNFQKRVINRNYLRLLERNPDSVVKKTPAKVSTTQSSRQLQLNKEGRSDPPKPISGNHASSRDPNRPVKSNKPRVMSATSIQEEGDDPAAEVRPYSPLAAAKAARLGAATPLALNPRDILALMARRREDGDT